MAMKNNVAIIAWHQRGNNGNNENNNGVMAANSGVMA
jgi:hypothetical protein